MASVNIVELAKQYGLSDSINIKDCLKESSRIHQNTKMPFWVVTKNDKFNKMAVKDKSIIMRIAMYANQLLNGIELSVPTDMKVFKQEYIKTSISRLDNSISMSGYGGMPKGRLGLLVGAEASAKTSIAFGMVADIQKQGGTAAWIDLERTYNEDHAKSWGVDTEALRPLVFDDVKDNTHINIFNLINYLVWIGVDLIIVDSITAMNVNTKQDKNGGEYDATQMGVVAKANSDYLKQIIPSMKASNSTLVMIAQLRSNIGPYGGDFIPGGKALAYYSSLTVKFQKIGDIVQVGDGKLVEKMSSKDRAEKEYKNVGWKIRWVVEKNKMSIQKSAGEDDYFIGKGFDPSRAILEDMIKYELFTKINGSHRYLIDKDGKEVCVNGNNQFRQYVEDLENREHLMKMIDDKIKSIELNTDNLVSSNGTGEKTATQVNKEKASLKTLSQEEIDKYLVDENDDIKVVPTAVKNIDYDFSGDSFEETPIDPENMLQSPEEYTP